MLTAFVLINVELGKEEDMLKVLRGMNGIKEAHFVYGPHDIIAKIEAEDSETLKNIVTFKIRGLNEVRSTLTMTVIEGILTSRARYVDDQDEEVERDDFC